MRELKFRAWGRDVKKFLYIELGPNAQIKDNIWRCYSSHDDREQYTGLKDKNGKEIYEGDILRLYDRFISQITWRETPVAFSWFANDGDGNCGLSKENEEYYEVIGNIHENKELLEENNNARH